MNVIFLFSLAIFFVLLAGMALGFIVTLFRVGQDRWSEAGQLSESSKKVLAGEVEADRDGLRDPRVAKGKVWSKATRKWQSQGKLSDDYLKNMVG